MSTVTVSNASQLMSALSGARGGDTILLKSGNYGNVNFSNLKFGSYVTVKSADGKMGAKFTGMTISNSTYLRVDNVHVDNKTNGQYSSPLVKITGGSHHIEFKNSEVNGLDDNFYMGHYGIVADNANYLTIENNYVHDVRRGLVGIGPDNFTVRGNTYEYIGDDSMKFGANTNVLIENNTGAGFIYPEAGAHLDFIQFQQSASNITVRGNVVLPRTGALIQGIFMDDGVYKNVLIEDNVIYNGLLRGISISSGSGITVRDNTVLTIPGMGHKASLVILPSGSVSENNIMSHAASQAGPTGSNLVVQWENPNGPYHYNDVYKNAAKGLGVTISDLKPVSGSPGTKLGAHDRINDILHGGDKPPADAGPAPQPEPGSGHGPGGNLSDLFDRLTDRNPNIDTGGNIRDLFRFRRGGDGPSSGDSSGNGNSGADGGGGEAPRSSSLSEWLHSSFGDNDRLSELFGPRFASSPAPAARHAASTPAAGPASSDHSAAALGSLMERFPFLDHDDNGWMLNS